MSLIDTVRTPDSLVDENEETPSYESLLVLIEKMQHDWVKLNEFLNRTAIYYQWCSDWEYRIAQYNREFLVLELQGRSDKMRSSSFGRDKFLLPSLQRKLPEDQEAMAHKERAIHAENQARGIPRRCEDRSLERVRDDIDRERQRERDSERLHDHIAYAREREREFAARREQFFEVVFNCDPSPRNPSSYDVDPPF